MKLVLAIVFLSGVAQAAPSTGRLVGRVVEPPGQGVPGVLVVAEQRGPDDIARSTVSGSDGTFVLEDLVPGPYQIRASADPRPDGEARAVVEPDAETSVSVTVGPLPEAPRRVRGTGGFLSGAALVRRTPAVAYGWLGARPALPGSSPGWQLDQFDFVHPVTGRPALRLSLNAFLLLGADEGGGSGPWGTGPRVSLMSRDGSNRYEGHAALLHDRRAGTAEAGAYGPVLRDSMWMAAWAQGGRGPHGVSGGQGLGKLSWQLSRRHKVNLVGALTRDEDRGTFAGAIWQGVLTDEWLGQAGVSSLRARDPRAGQVSLTQAYLDLNWFHTSRGWGEHSVGLQARGASLAADATSGRSASRRAQVGLEDTWRPFRSLSVLAEAGGATIERDVGRGRSGWSGSLALAWDASRDGRTAVRAGASRAVSPGLIDPSCPGGCLTLARLEQVSAGLDREVLETMLVGGEALLRRYRDDAGAGRDGWVVARLRRSIGTTKASVVYRRRFLPSGQNELTAMTGVGLARWLSLAVIVAHGPRAMLAVLRDEEPAAGRHAWLLGTQLRAEIGSWVGFPMGIWVDLPDLTRDARQFRLGLRAEL